MGTSSVSRYRARRPMPADGAFHALFITQGRLVIEVELTMLVDPSLTAGAVVGHRTAWQHGAAHRGDTDFDHELDDLFLESNPARAVAT